MKKNLLNIAFLMLICFSVFAKNGEPNLSRNHLLINGKPLIYDVFSLRNRGILTMVMGDPKTANTAKPIPFRIYLKRGDLILNWGASSYDKVVSEIEISEVLKLALTCDQLIIEPIDKNLQKAKQVIDLKENVLKFYAKKDGC